MFYSKAKKNAIEAYDREYKRYQSDCDSLEKYSKIYNKEKQSACDVIKNIENLINSISNTPKEFEKDFAEIVVNKNLYEEEIDFAKQSQLLNMGIALAFGLVPMISRTVLQKTVTAVGTKVVVGIGAKAIGVVSGPAGWVISGIGSISSVARNNKKTADKATVETIKIKKVRTELNKAWSSLMAVKGRLISARDIARNQYKSLYHLKDCDYTFLSDDDKLSLGTMVNETTALSKTLMEKPEWRIAYCG